MYDREIVINTARKPDAPRVKLQRGENEATFRDYNDRLAKRVKAVLPEDNQSSFPIRFTCECSNERCQDSIELTASDYDHLRQHPKQFFVLPDHYQTDIERVIADHEDYMIIEKYELPPLSAGKLNLTDAKEVMDAEHRESLND